MTLVGRGDVYVCEGVRRSDRELSFRRRVAAVAGTPEGPQGRGEATQGCLSSLASRTIMTRLRLVQLQISVVPSDASDVGGIAKMRHTSTTAIESTCVWQEYAQRTVVALHKQIQSVATIQPPKL